MIQLYPLFNRFYYELREYSDNIRDSLINKFSWKIEEVTTDKILRDDLSEELPFITDNLPNNCIGIQQKIDKRVDDGEYVKLTITKTYLYTLIKISGECLLIPHGLLEIMEIPYVIIDNDIPDKSLPHIPDNINDGITLYNFQVKTIRKCLYSRRGIVNIDTGGGKTEVIAGICKYTIQNDLFDKIIVVTPNVTNCEQLYSRLRLRGISEEIMGMYHGNSRDTLDRKILVGVIDSLRMDSFPKISGERVCMLVDECHHSSSDTWGRFILSILPDALIGFSGSVYEHEEEEDGYMSLYQDCFIRSLYGRTIVDIDQVYLRKVGLLAQPVVYMRNIGKPKSMGYTGGYNMVYDNNIVKNGARNASIIYFTKYLIESGLSVLILVQRHTHGLDLMTKLGREDVICVFGGGAGHRLEYGAQVSFNVDTKALASNIKSGSIKVIIASQVYDEGVDIPSIGAVIMAGGGQIKRRNIQRIGRGVRKKIGEFNRVFIIDFFDNTHVYMQKHSKKRFGIYSHRRIQSVIINDESTFLSIVRKQKNSKSS